MLSIHSTKRKFNTIHESSDNDDDNVIKSEEDGLQFNLAQLMTKMDNKLYREKNHIYFRDVVSKQSAIKLSNLLSEINNESKKYKMIFLHITSEGGSLLDGIWSVEILRKSKIPVTSIIEGYAIGTACLMTMGCKTRHMDRNSTLLMSPFQRKHVGLYNSEEQNNFFETQLFDIYKDTLGLKEETIKENMNVFMNSFDALQNKIINKINV